MRHDAMCGYGVSSFDQLGRRAYAAVATSGCGQGKRRAAIGKTHARGISRITVRGGLGCGGITCEGEDLGVVHQPVDYGGGHTIVGRRLSPTPKRHYSSP